MTDEELRKIAEEASPECGMMCLTREDMLALLDRVEKAEREVEKRTKRLEHFESEYNRLETVVENMDRAIARVRELHEPGNIIDVWGKSNSQDDDFQVCVECSDVDNWWVEYPCPTIRALEGDE